MPSNASMPASGGRFGPKAPTPAAIDHGARRDARPGVVLDDETRRRPARQPRHRLAEMIVGRERRGLLAEPLDQLGGIDPRIAGNVVDRLFRIERGALPARRRSSASNTWQRMSSMPHSNTAKSPTGPAPMIATSQLCRRVVSLPQRAQLSAGAGRAQARVGVRHARRKADCLKRRCDRRLRRRSAHCVAIARSIAVAPAAIYKAWP